MGSETAHESLQVSVILIGLFGGLSLFLYGMDQMTDALKKVAGKGMKTLLASLTTNRFKAAFTGAFVTAIIQSSSVTTVLVVGFISSGLLSLQQSIGIIMGANIGTTITAQVIAFKVTKYSLVLIIIGFGMQFFSKRSLIRRYGIMVMGLGLIFFGMDLMSDATKPLRSYEPFIHLLQQMEHPMMGIILAAVFTALVQSSSATTGIVIVLASQGFITLEVGISLIMGANIGTCVTAFLASLKKPTEAFQAAMVHILFNVVGCLIWYYFIPLLADFVRWFSPAKTSLEGISRLAAETPRQIANAHTVFNIANTVLFIGLVDPFARVVEYLVPKKREPVSKTIKPRFIDDTLLETPDLALDRVRMELGLLGGQVVKMVDRSLPIVLYGNEEELKQIGRLDDDVDILHEAVIEYLGKLSQDDLTKKQYDSVYRYMSIANYFENIGDTIEINLVAMAHDRIKNRVPIEKDTFDLLHPLIQLGIQYLNKTVKVVRESDVALAEEIIQAKDLFRRQVSFAKEELLSRLSQGKMKSPETYRVLMEIVENMRRMYYFVKRISKNELRFHDPDKAEELDQ